MAPFVCATDNRGVVHGSGRLPIVEDVEETIAGIREDVDFGRQVAEGKVPGIIPAGTVFVPKSKSIQRRDVFMTSIKNDGVQNPAPEQTTKTPAEAAGIDGPADPPVVNEAGKAAHTPEETAPEPTPEPEKAEEKVTPRQRLERLFAWAGNMVRAANDFEPLVFRDPKIQANLKAKDVRLDVDNAGLALNRAEETDSVLTEVADLLHESAYKFQGQVIRAGRWLAVGQLKRLTAAITSLNKARWIDDRISIDDVKAAEALASELETAIASQDKKPSWQLVHNSMTAASHLWLVITERRVDGFVNSIEKSLEIAAEGTEPGNEASFIVTAKALVAEAKDKKGNSPKDLVDKLWVMDDQLVAWNRFPGRVKSLRDGIAVAKKRHGVDLKDTEALLAEAEVKEDNFPVEPKLYNAVDLEASRLWNAIKSTEVESKQSARERLQRHLRGGATS